MCRLMLANKKGANLIEKKYGLAEYLLYLQNSCGGHGNGLSLLKNGQITYLHKGLSYSCNQIAKKMLTNDYDYAVFHTRIKSVGAVQDRNCHPFRMGKTVLAMNGTETSFSTIAELMDMTDTEAVLRVTKKMKLPLLSTLINLKSVYIGFDEGTPFVVSASSWNDLEIVKDDNGALVFGSEFPSDITSYKPVKTPFVWYEGLQLPKLEKVNHYAKALKFYKYAYSDGYDDYYNNYYDDYSSTSTKVKSVADINKKAVGTSYVSKERGEIEKITSKGGK